MTQQSKVSAIVSTYNAERWLRGRIDNLLDQTLYAAGRLEIVVVNSGSKQHEHRIVREYLAQGIPITLITSLRESIYVAWNRGIYIAKGDFLTNANTDDRLASHALERLADELDTFTGVDVVYADSHVTDTVNAAWDDFHPCHAPPYTDAKLNWPEYNRSHLLSGCILGPHPLWRKSLHERFGYFDESYQLAGDFELWLRLASNGVQMRHVNETLGLFYANGATGQNQAASDMEARRALLKWRRYLA